MLSKLKNWVLGRRGKTKYDDPKPQEYYFSALPYGVVYTKFGRPDYYMQLECTRCLEYFRDKERVWRELKDLVDLLNLGYLTLIELEGKKSVIVPGLEGKGEICYYHFSAGGKAPLLGVLLESGSRGYTPSRSDLERWLEYEDSTCAPGIRELIHRIRKEKESERLKEINQKNKDNPLGGPAAYP